VGLTSRDVVDRVQRWFPPRTRIGHTGTLDPLASGVLVLCVGQATRLGEYVQQMEKTYEVRVRLGARSATDDAEGPIEAAPWCGVPPDRARVTATLRSFLGEIEQVPPDYSAARFTGQRAYALARRGRTIALQPRKVRIYSIDILAYEYPALDLRVRCGKGTYIRALARDLGNALGPGAYVETLRRTRVGPFDVANALSVEADERTARQCLFPPESAVTELPRINLPEAAIARLRHGLTTCCSDTARNFGAGAEIAVFNESNRLAAIVKADGDGSLVPAKVLNWK
jgi:tRNA pseudouridine55 synthase